MPSYIGSAQLPVTIENRFGGAVMKVFGNSRGGNSTHELKEKKSTRAKKKTKFKMPQWVVVCLIVALLSFAGVVVVGCAMWVSNHVRPPDVIPGPLPGPGITDEPPATEGFDGIISTPDNPDDTTPPGEWEKIGRKDSVYTVLIVGVDDTSNTDTIMVAALDAKQGKLDVMSIPRDTQVDVKRSVKKINAAWAYGGVDQLKNELSTLIGFVPDVYALVYVKGFVRLIDTIDGVWFDVPRNMKYSDPTQKLYIDLEKGYQHLYGAEAIQLMRWRQNNNGTGYRLGDTERVALQQEFLKAVAKQTLKLSNVPKLGEFVDIAKENLETDLDVGQMLWFGQQLMTLSEEDIQFHMLPVDIGAMYHDGDYALVRQTEALELINETINPYLIPRTEKDLDISRLLDYWRP